MGVHLEVGVLPVRYNKNNVKNIDTFYPNTGVQVYMYYSQYHSSRNTTRFYRCDDLIAHTIYPCVFFYAFLCKMCVCWERTLQASALKR